MIQTSALLPHTSLHPLVLPLTLGYSHANAEVMIKAIPGSAVNAFRLRPGVRHFQYDAENLRCSVIWTDLYLCTQHANDETTTLTGHPALTVSLMNITYAQSTLPNWCILLHSRLTVLCSVTDRPPDVT